MKGSLHAEVLRPPSRTISETVNAFRCISARYIFDCIISVLRLIVRICSLVLVIIASKWASHCSGRRGILPSPRCHSGYCGGYVDSSINGRLGGQAAWYIACSRPPPPHRARQRLNSWQTIRLPLTHASCRWHSRAPAPASWLFNYHSSTAPL